MIWVTTAVVALVVIDVVLVSLALGRTSPEQNGPAGPIPTFTSTPDTTEAPSPSASSTSAPSASADPASATSSARRLLSAVDGLEAWRASAGTCGVDEPVLEHTVDGGATWVPVDLGADVGSLMAIRASSTGLSVLAGVGDGCTTTVRTSTDHGATWIAGASGAAGAGIAADGIVLSTGTVDEPCSDPIDAFQGQRTAVVVCDGQLEWRTGTSAWVDVPVGGVRSLAVDGNDYTLARVRTAQCQGVAIETMSAIGVTPSTATTAVGCVDDADSSGPVSIDRAGEDVWLWAGDDVTVSADGGVTW
ncbi:hypothetical protein [Curtobacterium sp. ZW137]|uniref:hypothetical protein n=1 Tax=Curtobacterium sp. ZW137 TaxID=2485104 RepID=UPI000F4D273F|nr:hypothetical protein [Curtobacterium sp. ZW137]